MASSSKSNHFETLAFFRLENCGNFTQIGYMVPPPIPNDTFMVQHGCLEIQIIYLRR